MPSPLNFAALTPAEEAALEGQEREAWYAWRAGDTKRLAYLSEAHGRDYGPVETETPEGRTDTETPERRPTPRRTKR